jgi:pyridoxine kinase
LVQDPVKILSLQSWVADGSVGNAAALFALQRLGAEVAAIHTVQFSNHPGHGAFTGRVYPAADTAALLQGLAAHGTLAGIDALLTGYIGSAEAGGAIAATAAKLRQARPDALWCCDPVMGDDGRLYVQPDLPDFFATQAVPCADVLTPNQFELATLTGHQVATLAGARSAALALQARMRSDGRRLVLVTSLQVPEALAGGATTLLVAPDGAWVLRTELLPRKFNGAGDLLSALLLFHLLSGRDALQAASRATASLAGILRRTWESGAAELQTVATQDELINPSIPVGVQAL